MVLYKLICSPNVRMISNWLLSTVGAYRSLVRSLLTGNDRVYSMRILSKSVSLRHARGCDGSDFLVCSP